MESKRAVPTFNSVAAEIGELVTSKNEAYGDSFAKCGEFLRLLYPTGLEPSKYGDALSMVRIFDKQMRIATRKDAFGESAYTDICGYGLLGATADAKAALFHTPLAPEEIQTINTSLSPPSLCGTCIRQGCPATNSTDCGSYLPPKGDGEGVAVMACDNCQRENCGLDPLGPVPVCGQHLPPAGVMPMWPKTTMSPAPFSLSLPSITVEGDLEEVHEKYNEEWSEWRHAEHGSLAEIIEAFDVLQVRQTLVERGGDVSLLIDNVWSWLELRYKETPDLVAVAKRAMIIKNAARAMYAPEVCLKIVMSGGREW